MTSCASSSSAASARLVARAGRRPARAPEGRRPRVSHETIYRFIYAQIRRTNDGSLAPLPAQGQAQRGWRGQRGGSAAEPHQSAVFPSLCGPEAVERRPPRPLGSRPHAVRHVRPGRPGPARTQLPHPPVARQPSKAATHRRRSSPGSEPSTAGCARPSPSTTAPSSPSTTSSPTARPSEPSSAIPTAPGRRAASKTPSADCAALATQNQPRHRRPTSFSTPASPPTTTRRRKCLDFKTPAEVFLKLLHFKCESTPSLRSG